MTFPVAVHLLGVVPALVLGAAMLFLAKGTRLHRALGRVWVMLMLVVAVSSFWIFEIRDGAGPSAIHLLSLWTLIALALALLSIRRGNRRAHQGFMIGTYIGLLAAGALALEPGRLLGTALFSG